jgi:hypothetical protein
VQKQSPSRSVQFCQRHDLCNDDRLRHLVTKEKQSNRKGFGWGERSHFSRHSCNDSGKIEQAEVAAGPSYLEPGTATGHSKAVEHVGPLSLISIRSCLSCLQIEGKTSLAIAKAVSVTFAKTLGPVLQSVITRQAHSCAPPSTCLATTTSAQTLRERAPEI